MSWEGVDVWRDEDGTPPPRAERDVGWWKRTYEAGNFDGVLDHILRAAGVQIPEALEDRSVA